MNRLFTPSRPTVAREKPQRDDTRLYGTQLIFARMACIAAGLLSFVIFLGSASIVIFFYLFPTGRFVPRWTRWLSIGAILFWGLKYFLPSFPFNPYNNILFVIIGFLATVGAIIIVQVYRYLLLSNS